MYFIPSTWADAQLHAREQAEDLHHYAAPCEIACKLDMTLALVADDCVVDAHQEHLLGLADKPRAP